MSESIKQMRVFKNDGQIIAALVESRLPSINQPDEVHSVMGMLRSDDKQIYLLKEVLNAQ